MPRRFQHRTELPMPDGSEGTPRVVVVAWGAHRYARSPIVTPATVTLKLAHWRQGESDVQFSADVEWTPQLARQLASALLEAANAAEGASATADDIHEQGRWGAPHV